MTAVDVDALAKLREAATAGPWQQDGTHVARGSRWTHDTSALAPTGSVEDAALIVAAVNALPELLAAVRERDALRKAVEGLAKKYDQPAQSGPWPEGTRSLYGGGQVAYDLLAALAAVDGEQ